MTKDDPQVNVVEDESQEDESQDKSKVEEEISEKLGTLLERTEGEKALLARLIANPQVRKLMEAEQSGKRLKLIEEGAEKPTGGISDLPSGASMDLSDVEDLEDLPRAQFGKDLVEKVSGVLEGVVGKSLAGLKGDLETVKSYIQDQEKAVVNKEIAQAREAHSDWDNYRKEMLGLHQTHPSLGAEDLYVLAKAKTGDKVSPKVETEKPAASAGRPSRTVRKAPLPPGRAGMQQLLNEASGKIDYSDIEGD